MLRHLHVADFAIIDEVDVDLEAGMTALTGETGAGKSILLDALNMVLGDRADTGAIRSGAKRAEITASFDISGLTGVAEWLAEQEMEAGDECILRRTIGSDGRSKGFINGRPTTMQSLRALGERLVDIHGQHEHQSLLKRDVQRQRLDAYADLGPAVSELRETYEAWRTARDRLDELQRAERERSERLDLLRYQVGELDALELTEDEWPQLEDEHRRLAHASKLVSTAQSALTALYEADEEAIYNHLSRIQGSLAEGAELDSALNEPTEALNTALIQLEETAEGLRRYLDRLEVDPGRFEWLEERMGAIHDLARKHQVEPGELPTHAETLRAELDELEHAGETLQTLAEEQARLAARYAEQAERLTEARQGAAEQLGAQVTEVMQTLGMEGGSLVIAVEPKSLDSETGEGFGPHGRDRVEIRVSTNAGQPARPLTKVASGGELSRISLAIQMIAAGDDGIPTLIFDEVDAGIGGGVAEIVGRHLRSLGEGRQVMCVTHLPQVAAQAHHHLQVSKLAGTEAPGEEAVRTRIRELVAEARVEEVARMLGGVEITEQTLKHAEEMIQRAESVPASA